MRSVLVSDEFFTEAVFKSAQPRREFGEEDGRQKMRQGVPVWTVKVGVAVLGRNGNYLDDLISVSVASPANPGDTFGRGDLVEFERLAFGVAQTKTGYSTWFSADRMRLMQ